MKTSTKQWLEFAKADLLNCFTIDGFTPSEAVNIFRIPRPSSSCKPLKRR